MNKTSIEWVRNPDGTPGYTFNPITGCLNHVNGLCKGGGFPCYAYKLANGRLKQRYLANKNLSHDYLEIKRGFNREPEPFQDPFYPRFWPEKISGELNQRSSANRVKAKGIFVCDMSDLFGIGIPEEETRQVLDKIRMRSYHRFYLLTKQPQNLVKFSPFPDNCWVGVTATNSWAFIDAMFWLRQVDAKVKYLSMEPLQEQILPHYIGGIEGINWLIIGAQTKPYKPPKIEWVKEIVDAADKAEVPVFLKDNLIPMFEKADYFSTPEWALDNKRYYRQELPV